eukprot:scaffold253_cov472-Pavlova_lutheri.AAC.1
MWAIHPTGNALPHMHCRLASLTFAAAVSPGCIPTNRSRSLTLSGRSSPPSSWTQVVFARSLCDRELAIKVGHFKRGRFRASRWTVAPASKHS